MEIRTLKLPLRGFGAHPTGATIEICNLSLTDRIRRAALIFAIGLVGALIALPIPLIHFILVPTALLLGFVFGINKLRQAEVFRGARGSCPFCGTEQSFTVMGTFKLPKRLYCSSCRRELILYEPTIEPQRSPTGIRSQKRS